MRFLLLAFNPHVIEAKDLQMLSDVMEGEMKCRIYLIPHYDDTAEPIYCVQFVDTITR